MHLKNWFNFKYLYQNLKKSKGLLTFLVCAIFFVNLWMVGINLLSGNYIINFSALSNVTAIIAFIFPVLLAFILLGFVFKRTTVDFIMAKPIDRKQIFCSNIIGGISIILVVILLNTIGFILLSLFTNLFIPLGAIFDYFIYWLVTYIFIFIIASLGISVAGNKAGAIVIVLLVLFLFPTLTLIEYGVRSYNSNNYLVCESAECLPSEAYCNKDSECLANLAEGKYYYSVDERYTAILSTPVSYFNIFTYDTASVIKTIILSIIYLIGAYYLFKYRKMENTEVGFKNKYLYKVVKILTYIPVIYLAYCFFETDSVFLLVSIIICLGYYIIYDLIIKRELENIFRTICEFLVVSAILMGIYYVIDKIYSNGVNITMPEEVNVYYYDDNLSYGYDIKISDQELINELIKAELIPSSYSGILIIIDGKHYLAKNVSEELLKKIDDYAEYNDLKDEFTVDNILHITSNYNSRVVIPNTIELKEMLIDYMKDYEYNPNVIDCYIDLYKYENHELRQVSIEVGNNKEIFNLVKNYFNDSFLSNYEGVIDHISNLEDGELLKIVRSFPTELSLFMQGHKHDELTGDVVILYSGGDRFYIDRDVFMNDFLMKYGDNVEEQNN